MSELVGILYVIFVYCLCVTASRDWAGVRAEVLGYVVVFRMCVYLALQCASS